jgi:hypothetical protein
MSAPVYNFAYLDEQTKRMIRRAILKAIAIPGYQVPFASREMPMPYGWGTGGVQVTAAILGPDDVLKVIDQGSDDTTNAVSIRKFFAKTAGVRTTTRTSEATVISGQGERQVRERSLADAEIRQSENEQLAGAAAVRRGSRKAHLRHPAAYGGRVARFRGSPVRALSPRRQLRALRLEGKFPRRSGDRRSRRTHVRVLRHRLLRRSARCGA